MVCSAEGCDRLNNYSEEMVLDQLTMGLNDHNIQKKFLGCKEENFNLNFVERLVINQECSKATQKDSKVNDVMAPLSTFKRDKKAPGKQTGKKCTNCGSPSHPSYRDLKKEEKDKCLAHGKHCEKCGKKNHLAAVCKSKDVAYSEAEAEQDAISLLNLDTEGSRASARLAERHNLNGIGSAPPKHRRRFLNHVRFDKEQQKFILHSVKNSNVTRVKIEVDKDSYKQLGGEGQLKVAKVTSETVYFTGAARCCAPTASLKAFRIKESDLFQSSLNLFAADRRKLVIKGCIPVTISMTRNDGSIAQTRDILYFVDSLRRKFVSRDALTELGVTPSSFPSAQPVTDLSAMLPQQETQTGTEKNKDSIKKTNNATAQCRYPVRATAPDAPKLERDIETYSVEELRSILIEHYKSSTFNTSTSSIDARPALRAPRGP